MSKDVPNLELFLFMYELLRINKTQFSVSVLFTSEIRKESPKGVIKQHIAYLFSIIDHLDLKKVGVHIYIYACVCHLIVSHLATVRCKLSRRVVYSSYYIIIDRVKKICQYPLI